MRPKSIILFEQLFLLALLVSLAATAISFGDISAVWQNDPNVRRVGLGTAVLVGAMALDYALYLLLWFLVARKRSNAAKWILVVLVAVSLVAVPSGLKGPLTLATGLGLAGIALDIVALAFLFKADAKAWLKRTEGADPIVPV